MSREDYDYDSWADSKLLELPVTAFHRPLSCGRWIKPLKTMRLSDLIDELQSELDSNGDIDVVLVSDYGDSNHTKQALGIDCIASVNLEGSAYSSSGYAVCEDATPDESSTERVLAISSVFLEI